MAFLIIDGRQHALGSGDTPLSAGRSAAPSSPATSPAIVNVTVAQEATILRVDPQAEISVDGVRLGAQPVTLRHGSRIVLEGQEIVFSDPLQGGSTRHIAGISVDALALLTSLPSEPTSDSGGRLIALDDGREYDIPVQGIEIGRDPLAGVVVASSEVSRRHAVIAPGLFGYTLTDMSSNGVLVNGARVDATRVLGAGDIIRIGDREFRFEAEGATYEPSAALRDAPGEEQVRTKEPVQPHAGAPTPAAVASTLLATLEIVNEGLLKGTRLRVERPVAHIGRGEHNDLVLSESSVSGSHAVLQRRKGGWYVVDASSRNGTYVDGERIHDERQLAGVCELRFGNIKTVFRAIAGSATDGKGGDGTLNIVGVD